MPKNDEGEFELVVGNRQLLSLVFVLMVLFGVVFSMGYFVGRNSSPEAKPLADAAQPRAPQADSARPATTPASTPSQPGSGESPLEPGEAKVVTQPVAASPSQPAGGPSEAPPAAESQPEPEPAPPPRTAEPEKPAPAAAPGSEPLAGQTYLQVAAVKRAEAELVVDVLKKRGFAALVAPVVPGQPEDALWRALVGPLKDAAAVAKTRADLQAAGFKTVIVRKY